MKRCILCMYMHLFFLASSITYDIRRSILNYLSNCTALGYRIYLKRWGLLGGYQKQELLFPTSTIASAATPESIAPHIHIQDPSSLQPS
ncbi:hypothetical protein BDQ17DRAFT_1364182 [Cyathus striatus]|nr:hypothetical protein BDQ17DRAFT_1364182 [Cyathus striatus]